MTGLQCSLCLEAGYEMPFWINLKIGSFPFCKYCQARFSPIDIEKGIVCRLEQERLERQPVEPEAHASSNTYALQQIQISDPGGIRRVLGQFSTPSMDLARPPPTHLKWCPTHGANVPFPCERCPEGSPGYSLMEVRIEQPGYGYTFTMPGDTNGVDE